jgi:hypothetical protein
MGTPIKLWTPHVDRNLEPIHFIPHFEEIAGQWNGDESGRGEDRAHIALEIIELLKELQNT